MRFSSNGMLRGLILSTSVLLAACGGGGGGGSSGGLPGGPVAPNDYKVQLTASRTEIPLTLDLNACTNPPSYSWPGATTIFVNAHRERTKDPIPGGDDVFGCNVVSGLESGSLYYFRGSDDDKVTVTCDGVDVDVEGSYRSIVLGSNSGGNSFHVLSRDRVGTVVVRCTATDPVSRVQTSQDISIRVGGEASGRPSQVVLNHTAPNLLFVQGLNGPTQRVVQVRVVDEAGQVVPNPPAGVANLRARIVSSSDPAGATAILRAGVQSGQVVTSSTINGQAQFTIVSGSSTGNIAIEFAADRADNNVDNGISEIVSNAAQFAVVRAVASSPLEITTEESLPGAFELTSYVSFLEATGGVPPYRWTLLSGSTLPAGLSLTGDGVVIGTPTQVGEEFRFAARVTDDLGVSQQKSFSISVEGVLEPLSVTTSTLPQGEVDVFYSTVLSAQGGRAPYRWETTTLPTGLALTGNNNQIISGTPASGGVFRLVATAVDSLNRSASRDISLTIQAPGPLAITTGNELPDGVAGNREYLALLSATGGKLPYAWSKGSGGSDNVLVSAGGVVSLTTAAVPVVGDVYYFVATVTDANGLTATTTFSIEFQ